MGTNESLTMKRTFAASQERLFAMWTTADLMKQWFCPGKDMTMPVAEVDARDGGNYRIVMQNKDGETYSPSGVYECVRPHDKLVFSWKWADSEIITRVTIELRAISDSETELTLTHEGFPEADMRDRHSEGWDGCLARLAEAA